MDNVQYLENIIYILFTFIHNVTVFVILLKPELLDLFFSLSHATYRGISVFRQEKITKNVSHIQVNY